jgi:hypothetical protein
MEQEQIGGHSFKFIKFDNEKEDIHIKPLQKTRYEKLIIQGAREKKYCDQFFEELNNLLVFDNGIININFLNNFNRNIYTDIEHKLDINTDTAGWFSAGTGKSIFKNPNVPFKIVKTISAGGSGGKIYFIENKMNPNEKYVLKSYQLNIPFDKIPDYQSLEMVRISNNAPSVMEGFQTNYMTIAPNSFKSYFDKSVDATSMNYILNTNDVGTYEINAEPSKLLIGCPQIEFYNDIFVNIILQKIALDLNDANPPIVKYHEFYLSHDNGVPSGFILMDQYEGASDALIGMRAPINIDNKIIIFDELIKQITPFLIKTKHPLFKFTHTDLKLENIFYRKINDDYKFYIGDFDKSSITYNNVRFYCKLKNHNVTQSVLSKYIPTLNLDKNNMFHFNINQQFRYTSGMNTESIIMRYIIFPFYPNWDFTSILLSANTVLGTGILESEDYIKYVKNNFGKYMNFVKLVRIVVGERGDWNNNIEALWTVLAICHKYRHDSVDMTRTTPYMGDFGKLITAFVGNPRIGFKALCYEDISNLWDINVITLNKRSVRTILLDKQNNKMILTFPSYYIDYAVGDKHVLHVVLMQSKEYRLNIIKTKQYYDSNNMVAENYMGDMSNYTIYYNANDDANPDMMYVKVNRFSNTSLSGFSYLYEYSIITDADVLGLIHIMRDQYIQAHAPVQMPAPAPAPESIPAPVPAPAPAPEFSGGEMVKYRRKYLKYKKKYLQMKQ